MGQKGSAGRRFRSFYTRPVPSIVTPLVVGLSLGMVILFLLLTVVSRLSEEAVGGQILRKPKHHSVTESNRSKTAKEYDVAYLNQHHGSSVDNILEWVCSEVQRESIVQLTSFGASSLVILDQLKHRDDGCMQRIPVIFIDTLHLFPETYRFVDTAAKDEYGIQKLHLYQPSEYKSKEEFDNHYGADLYKMNPEKYGLLTKVEPTQRALKDFRAAAWITGRRRSQGGERTSLQAFEEDSRQRLKINPLVDWTYEQVWDYIRKHKLSYNPLYDQGYKSIGDVQTTSKVAPEADERSGRFQGLSQTECGMHNMDSNNENITEISEERTGPSNHTNGNYIELTRLSFNDTILDESAPNTFLVFYSPRCGHCRHFEPTFVAVAKEFKARPNMQAARFNVEKYNVPQIAKDVGLKVPGTPALYLVQHQPLKVTKYMGMRDKDSILRWLEKNGE